MELRRHPRLGRGLLIGLVVVLTVIQIIQPGVNQDVRYVLGAQRAAQGFGLGWADVWVHRPFTARALMAVVGTLSGPGYWSAEIAVRAWSVLLAALAGLALRQGMRSVMGRDGANWVGIAAVASLAWAPGWDFAEPEWYATAIAVAAIGLTLNLDHRRATPLLGGLLLAIVVLLKLTTGVIALAALILLAVIDRRLAIRTAIATAVCTILGFLLTCAISPHEWQWLREMPELNPGLAKFSVKALAEGLVNEAVVSPLILVFLVAQAWLWWRGGRHRAWMWGNLGVLTLLVIPFVAQAQNFLYHLAPVPVFAAISVATIAHRAVRVGEGVPVALPVTGAAGFFVSVMLFWLPARVRDQHWWIAGVLMLGIVALGVALVWWQPSSFRELFAARISSGRGWLAMACLMPLLVTMSPSTAYSFSLAHRTTTSGANLALAKHSAATASRVHARLAPDLPVVYLSFGEAWELRNPSTCRYVSPTWLQRASARGNDPITRTESFGENLDCLSDPAAQAVVIETSWFDPEKANPRVRDVLEHNFDCDRHLYAADGLLICPRRR